MNRDKPNILFIITNQQRVETLGHLDRTPCETPNLDRLAAGDPNVAIPLAAKIATMVGGIAGTFVRRIGLKESWVTKALDGDYGLDELTNSNPW